MAKKTAAAAPAGKAGRSSINITFVDVALIKKLLTELRTELEKQDAMGCNRKVTTALVRINDLLPLLICQENMTK